MKTLKISLAVIITVLCMPALCPGQRAADGDGILGVYWSPEKNAKVEIYKKGDQYFGRSIWLAHPRKDTKNPDKHLQDRQLLGIDLFCGFRYEGQSYTSGKVYDPKSGKTYDCKMSLNGDILKVRGYIGISLFGRTENFQRVR